MENYIGTLDEPHVKVHDKLTFHRKNTLANNFKTGTFENLSQEGIGSNHDLIHTNTSIENPDNYYRKINPIKTQKKDLKSNQ